MTTTTTMMMMKGERLVLKMEGKAYFRGAYRLSGTRIVECLEIINVQVSFGKPLLKFKGSVLWNSLPASIKEPMSVARFMKLTKILLLTDRVVTFPEK